MICNGKLQTLYMRLFTLCSCLITKESYDRWITRRVWGFRHQISKVKNLKNVGRKYREASGEFRSRSRWLRNFAVWRTPFRSLRNWPSALCDRLPNATTHSFQLRIMHRLKPWIFDLPSFETKYSMNKLSFRKCSKSGWQWLSFWMLHGGFLSLLSLLSFMICLS